MITVFKSLSLCTRKNVYVPIHKNTFLAVSSGLGLSVALFCHLLVCLSLSEFSELRVTGMYVESNRTPDYFCLQGDISQVHTTLA